MHGTLSVFSMKQVVSSEVESVWSISGNNPEMLWLYYSMPWTLASLVSFSVQIHSGTAAFVYYSAQFLKWANFSNAAFSKAVKKFKNTFFLLLPLGELQNSVSVYLYVPLWGELGDVLLITMEDWMFTNLSPVAYGEP